MTQDLVFVLLGFILGFMGHGLIRSIVDLRYGGYGLGDIFKPRRAALHPEKSVK